MKFFNAIATTAAFISISLISLPAGQASVVVNMDTGREAAYNDGDSNVYVIDNGEKIALYGYAKETVEVIKEGIYRDHKHRDIGMPYQDQPRGFAKDLGGFEGAKPYFEEFVKLHRLGRVCEKDKRFVKFTGRISYLSGCYTQGEYASMTLKLESINAQVHAEENARRRAIGANLQRAIQMNRPRTCFGSANTFGSTTYGSATCY